MTDGQTLLLQRLEPFKLKQIGANKWTFFSPLREEKKASGSLEFRGDQVLLYDPGYGDGSGDAILAKLGLTWPEVLSPRTEAPAGKSRIVATYNYQNADGSPRYEICRFVPKDFRPRRRGPDGKWLWNLKGVERIPYHLPEILCAPADSPIFIVEGEKDADALTALGLIATTNPGGTGSTKLWSTRPFRDPLVGRDLVIIPDADEPGAKHAAYIANALAGIARSIKVVRL
jgi:hypothetical protein